MGNFTNQAAYKALVDLYNSCLKNGYLEKAVAEAVDMKLPWRLNIIPLTRVVQAVLGAQSVELRTLKTRCLVRDPFFKALFPPRPKTPQTERRKQNVRG
jgi:hypothetical protein